MPLVKILPFADHVRRVCVIEHKDQNVPFVRLQYTSSNNEWYEIELPLPEAIRLQNLLERAGKERQFDSVLRNL